MGNEKLEAARMRKRWSVAVASEKVGVSINTFNRWERGLQIPQLGTLDQLCRAFDVSPEELGFGDAIMMKRRPQPAQQQPAADAVAPCPPIVSDSEAMLVPLDALTRSQPMFEGRAPIELLRRSLDSMNLQFAKDSGEESRGVSRRQAITTLVGAPATVFGLAQGMNAVLLRPEEVLTLCEVHVPLCWRLYFEGGMVEVEAMLPGYLSQLLPLTQKSSTYQKRAAALVSQGYQLASLLSLQHQNFGTAHNYALQAFEFGKLAEDPSLQTASLIRQAAVYFYLKHPIPRLQVYQRALELSGDATALIKSRIYVGLTETHGSLGHEYEAKQFLDLAHATFPARFEEDPTFSYTHFNTWSIVGLQGLMHLNLNQPGQAWESLTQIEKDIPTALVPNRLELIVRQAAVAVALDDKEHACACVGRATKAAQTANNQLRYDEAYMIFVDLRGKWGNDDRSVKTLQELFA